MLLPPSLLGRVRAAAGRSHALVELDAVDGPGGLTQRLAARADVVIVDPADRRCAPARDRLGELFARHPAVPALFYTSLTSEAIIAVAPLLRDGLHELLIAGVEDQPGALRARIERLGLRRAAANLLAAIEPAMHRLTPGIARAVQHLLASPRDVRSVADLAATAATTPRHLARVVLRAGLARPRDLVMVARATFVHHAVRTEGRSMRAAARALQCDPRALSRQVRATLRVASPYALAQIGDDELVRRCARAMCTRRTTPAARPAARTLNV